MGNIEIVEITPKFEYVREVSRDFMLAIFDSEILNDDGSTESSQGLRWIIDQQTKFERIFVIYKNTRFFEINYNESTPAGRIMLELNTAINLDSSLIDSSKFQ
ncbi:hypothetical protein DCO58_11855 [Helicobacter saguini]|uniref:Uncharacterized protein n=1 Tax=Helicobacter saguini TaxID=1548018 RepID=A0A347VQA5_9HELI|nr:hypothetical protein [Helicobacter saguini]MWV61017.1 hypothetical protein [Helicobacter saguini]MWV68314.1 hypothetical protein [Helicobacter saguini]MWV70221.1 hypothetical protein [Helicobacter saguini]MWV72124.1 hypothetical protein [Helicobacter saguini]TLD91627.1 hypothetical protein LS64_011585 [Helicobacter saguini]